MLCWHIIFSSFTWKIKTSCEQQFSIMVMCLVLMVMRGTRGKSSATRPCHLAYLLATYLACLHLSLLAILLAGILTCLLPCLLEKLIFMPIDFFYIAICEFIIGCKILWYSSWNLIFILSHSFRLCFSDDSLSFLSNHNIKWYKTRISFFEILVVVWERNSKVINNYDVGIKRRVYLCTCCFRECDE